MLPTQWAWVRTLVKEDPACCVAWPKKKKRCSRSKELHSFFFFNLFVYFLAALGLRCCMQAFSSGGEQGLLFVAVHGLLIAVASLVAEHGL